MRNPGSVTLLLFGILSIEDSSALSLQQKTRHENHNIQRRKVLGALFGTVPVLTVAKSAQAAKNQSIASRIDAETLTMPPSSRGSELNGIGRYCRRRHSMLHEHSISV